MNRWFRDGVGALALTLMVVGCSGGSSQPPPSQAQAKPAQPPEPVVTHVDARLPDGREMDRSSCVAALSAQQQPD